MNGVGTIGQVLKVTQGGKPRVPSNVQNWVNKDLAPQGNLSSPSISLAMQFRFSLDLSSPGMSLVMQ